MKWPKFQDLKRHFIVVCFVQENDFEDQLQDLEQLGKQRNVRLIVQPGPFEAMEFLFQIDADLLGHLSSFDKELYWKALAIEADLNKKLKDEIATTYHEYFCAILEQDEKKIVTYAAKMHTYESHFMPPDEDSQ